MQIVLSLFNCLIDRWLKNIDQGKLTGVLFIDLSKAFDTVNHNVLIHKLKSFGICENTSSEADMPVEDGNFDW
jgi:hypothetical protein